ncbi:MAG: PAS domain S-box protein, partial [Desulfatirhabdiaceae bacterium]
QLVRRDNGVYEIPFVSESAVRFLGRPLEELHYASQLFEDVHPDDLEGMWSSIEESARTMTPWLQEFRIVGKKGIQRWLRGVSSPGPLPDGGICWNGVLLDITELKQAENALKESESFTRVVMDNLHIGFAVNSVDPDVKFHYMNDNFPRIYRTTREALSDPDVFWNVVYEDPVFREEIKKRVLDDCASGDPKRMRWTDIPIIRKNGDTTYIDATNIPIPGKRLMVSTVWDVTDRKQAEYALHQSEIHYRSLFDNSMDAFLFVSPDGSIHDANPAACRMFGRTVEEIKKLGRNGLMDMTDPRSQKALEDRARTGKAQAEITMVRADQTKFPAEISSVVFIDQNGLKKSSVVIRDITDRKQAEDNLRRSESLLRSIFQAAPIGIGVVRNRVLLTANDRYCEMTGFSREELIGQSTRMIYLSDADFEFLETEPYRQIHEHGTGMTETRWQRKDGSVIDVLMNFAPINTLNLDEGVAITALDITERKKAEEGKDKLQAQLLQAQKMESVGRLAGGVAHDFNNMLNVILGYTELSMEKLAPLDPVQADLKEILSAAQHSADITRQLLAFARKQIIAPKVLDLNNTVEDMLKMLRRMIGEDIDLAWLPGKNLGKINMDPSQLDQILANLCVNARDAITGVGRVSIETANATFDSDYCSDHSWCITGDFVLLAVTDTGCGMDPKTMEQIFEPFFTTKELNKGTGLGLATVYGIVKQNGGFINVYSELGKGTTFKIYLPRDTSPVQNEEENISKIPFSHGETVLVVEDEGSILRLTEEILKGLGYTTITANTPGKAINLSKVHSGQIDLLITDVIMPEMNGQQLAEQLMIQYPKIKCLFMSGYTTNVIVHRGLLNSGLNFIQKPYSKKGLAVKIREVLDSK